MSGNLRPFTNEVTHPSLRENDLPIGKYKNHIIDMVLEHQIVIVFGETGSGKTTQIPQYLLNAGINEGKVIGVTQPRKIAAINMAKRICQEMYCCLGIEVGYEVRFNKRFSSDTKIKFMTDGILLNQCLLDVKLSDYGVIMIDEAHERSVETDVLLGLLKMITEKRKDLKLLITSATMNTEKFTNYFRGAPVITAEGKMYDVEIIYQQVYSSLTSYIINVIKNIQMQNDSGDVLIFLTGQKEIDECCENLQGIEGLVVLPLYGALGFEDQQRIFQPVRFGKRKVIVSTNIAETSITVDGIRFVIDSGYVKQNQYNPQTGMESLQEVRISQSQANQRRGRAGRTNTGWCYRCYSAEIYRRMNKDITPDIYRKNLCGTFLRLVAMGLNPMTFPFIDSPKRDTLQSCLNELQDLELLNERKEITELGKIMQDFPVEPKIGKVLFISSTLSCSEDVTIILAMLTERHIFIRSQKTKEKADSKKKQFFDSDGDHFMLLNVFKKWIENKKSKFWCIENCINFKTMNQIELIRAELWLILKRKNLILEKEFEEDQKDRIKISLLFGFSKNICQIRSKGIYINYHTKDVVYMHPGSCLRDTCPPDLIFFHEVVETRKPYMREVVTLTVPLVKAFGKEKENIRKCYSKISVSNNLNLKNLLNPVPNNPIPDNPISNNVILEVHPHETQSSFFKYIIMLGVFVCCLALCISLLHR